MSIDWKQIQKLVLPHVLAFAGLVILGQMLFSPQYQGKTLQQGDILQGRAMQGEILQYEGKDGRQYYWNNSMFGGMPWDLLVYGRDRNKVRVLRPIPKLNQPGAFGVFIGIGILSYFALILMGVGPWLAFMGAGVMMLNVNHIVLLEAGHNNKLRAIMFFPTLFAGVLLALREGSLWRQIFGAALVGGSISLAVSENHPQMLYYFLFSVAVWFVVRMALGLKDFDKSMVRGLALLVLCAILGIASNATQISSTMTMSENTMRGKPVLESPVVGNQSTSSNVDGLAWDYAMQWSNAWRDVYSLVVPRAVGGSSAEEVPTSTETGRILRQNRAPVGKDGHVQSPLLYWGALPFTSGPYYIGALVFFLFVLSFFVLKTPYRWAFGLMFLLLVLMSLGKNLEGLNRFLFDNLPYYNKFRAPNSVLHATAFLIIVPGLLALRRYLQEPDQFPWKKVLLPATAIAGGFCLVLALMGGSLFDFERANEATRYAQNPGFLDLLIADRKTLLRQDALRSLGFILAGAALLWAFAQKHLKSSTLVLGGLVFLCVADLYTVSRRYLDEDNWGRKKSLQASFPERPVDQQIKTLEGGKRYQYRVLDLSINTFNSASTSLYHNTIGGYNAAKPQRAQDLIDRYIGVSIPNMNVMSMLNAKYIITRDGKLQTNPNAMGNAWYVKDVALVSSSRDELEGLGQNILDDVAVIHEGSFGESLQGLQQLTTKGTVRITDYTPDRIVYQSQHSEEGVVVFSEAWYPQGWTASIDGEPVPILRANYMLRALRVPAGTHEIVFEYEPPAKAAGLTLMSSLLLLLVLLGSSYMYGREQWRSAQEKLAVASQPATPVKTKKATKKKSKRR